MTDILLLIGSIICFVVGLAGAVLPLPGPPISLIGLFMLHYSKYAQFDRTTLTFFALLTVGMSIFDYYAPIWGTKKFGGTKYGSWGSTIGLMAGLFFTPIGMFLGAFLGAFLGEIIGKTLTKSCLKSCHWLIYWSDYRNCWKSNFMLSNDCIGGIGNWGIFYDSQ